MKNVVLILFLLLSITNYCIGQSSLDSLRLVLPLGHTEWVNCSKIRSNILYTGSQDKTIKLWDLKSKKELVTFYPSSDIVFELDVTENGRFILSTHQKNYIIIQDTKNREEKKRIEFKSYETCEMAFFSSNDSLIIVLILNAELKESVRVYNFFTLKEISQNDIPLPNKKLKHSQDKKYWFFLNDTKTISYNSFSNGLIKTVCR